MATTSQIVTRAAPGARVTTYPASNRGFDWIAAGLAAWLIGGLYLDGWAHFHGRVDDVFFTPWHAVLYSGALAIMIFLSVSMARNLTRGHTTLRALPRGYWLSLIGAGIFAVGGVLDLIWHELFGAEVEVEALLSPTHLVLAVGGVLMATGPLRSIWQRRLSPAGARGWLNFGPLLLAATLLLSVLTFFTSYAHPLQGNLAAVDPFRRSPGDELYVMRADGAGQTRLRLNPNLHTTMAAWSPDGKQIAYTAGSDESYHLYIIDTDSALGTAAGAPRQITSGAGGQAWAPAWSPDGARLVFSATAAEARQALFIVSAAGGAMSRLLATGPRYQGDAAWSPDGRRIAFCGSSSGLAGQWQLYVADAAGSRLTQLTQGDGCGPSWAADSRNLAYHSCLGDNCDLWTMDVDAVAAGAGTPHQITNSPTFEWRPNWSPDGQQLIYAARLSYGSSMDVYSIPVAGGEPTNLSDNAAMSSWAADVARDGRIVYTAGGNESQPGWLTEQLGLAGILLQAALLTAVVLPLARHIGLPFGALTLIVGLNSLMMAVLEDRYWLALAAVGAGLLADVVYAWLRPATTRRERLYVFAFILPVLVSGMNFLVIGLSDGIAWSLHLWLGAILTSGIIGLLLAVAMQAAESSGQGLPNAAAA